MSRALNLNDYNTEQYQPIIASSGIYRDVHTRFIHPITGDAMIASDIGAIKNSIKNIILTEVGSRPFNPEFGTRVTDMLFENIDPITQRQITLEIENGITKFEPRISEYNVKVVANNDRNSYDISIIFQTIYSQTGEIKFILNKIR
jgi:phage baseplate assembly protein W